MIRAGASHSAVQGNPQQQTTNPGFRMILQMLYDARVAFSWMHLVIPILLGLILWGMLSGPMDFRQVRAALVNLELLLPMLAGLLVSDTITREWAEGTAGWRLTQPGGPFRLLTLRLLNTLILWIAIVAVFLIAVQVLYLRPAELTMPWRDVVVRLGPPALFFAGFGMLISLLGRSSLSGLLATAGYWALTWMSGGTFTGPFHVIYLRAPLETWTYEATRWWLVAGGMLLLIIGGLIFAKGERWVR